jgi:TolA-binding protein
MLSSSSLRLVVVSALAAATALGCGWPVEPERTLRFSSRFVSEADLDRLPSVKNDATVEGEEGEFVDACWTHAMEQERSQDFVALRSTLRKYLESTGTGSWSTYYSPHDVQARRNGAIDRLDALTALDSQTSSEGLAAYFSARYRFETGVARKDVLPAEPVPPSLADNVAYLAAAISYRDAELDRAAFEFEQMAHDYPKSEKADAALYMAALSWTKSTEAFRHGSFHQSSDSVEVAWREAYEGFARYLRNRPSGRFEIDARGWLAFLDYHGKEPAKGLAAYYRMLVDEREPVRREALVSLRMAHEDLDPSVLPKVEALLSNDPKAALAYAYYELYNNLPSSRLPSAYDCCCDGGSPSEEPPAVRVRIAAFATKMAAKTHGVAPAFFNRAAMANLELGEYDAASRLARKAIAGGAKGEELADALFVAGVADRHRGEVDAARKSLERLVALKPGEEIEERARKQLAMIAEDAGDLGAALDQYIALDYTYDVAYLVDVLMTPEQLAAYLAEHPSHPMRDVLWYSLGVKYLRDWKLDEARRAYARARTIPTGSENPLWEESLPYPKAPFEVDWSVAGVRSRWIARDLQTIEDLERLIAARDAAVTVDEAAEASYQLASYLYEASSLLYYNPALWQGERYGLLSSFDYSLGPRLPGESEALWQYMRKHEPASHALDLYLELVDIYPLSKAAPDALYTAALCHGRLSAYNDYWREAYAAGRHAGSRLVSIDDVRRAYPRYQLPRGTDGWEPATRTVNGGPGWAPPPPRPAPKPRWQHYRDRALEIATPPAAWAWAAATGHLARLWTAATSVWWTQITLFALGLALYAWWRAMRDAARMRRLVDGATGDWRSAWRSVWWLARTSHQAIHVAFGEAREIRDGFLRAFREILRRALWFTLRTRAGLYAVLFGLPACGILLFAYLL